MEVFVFVRQERRCHSLAVSAKEWVWRGQEIIKRGMESMWHIDYFSGDVVDLPKKERTPENVLRVLAKNPTVSTFGMSENYKWLPGITNLLEEKGFVQDETKTVGYPWHKFVVTESGREHLKGKADVA